LKLPGVATDYEFSQSGHLLIRESRSATRCHLNDQSGRAFLRVFFPPVKDSRPADIVEIGHIVGVHSLLHRADGEFSNILKLAPGNPLLTFSFHALIMAQHCNKIQ
jgi:hypothetical protein